MYKLTAAAFVTSVFYVFPFTSAYVVQVFQFIASHF